MVAWLESPEGTAWAHEHFNRVTSLITVKGDKVPTVDAFLWYAKS